MQEVLVNWLGGLRPDFTSKLVHVLAFGTPKFYIAPYDKIKRELANLSSNCDVKLGLSLPRKSVVRLTDCPDMTIDVYRGHKTITQQQQQNPTKGLWPRGQRSKPYIQGVSKKRGPILKIL